MHHIEKYKSYATKTKQSCTNFVTHFNNLLRQQLQIINMSLHISQSEQPKRPYKILYNPRPQFGRVRKNKWTQFYEQRKLRQNQFTRVTKNDVQGRNDQKLWNNIQKKIKDEICAKSSAHSRKTIVNEEFAVKIITLIKKILKQTNRNVQASNMTYELQKITQSQMKYDKSKMGNEQSVRTDANIVRQPYQPQNLLTNTNSMLNDDSKQESVFSVQNQMSRLIKVFKSQQRQFASSTGIAFSSFFLHYIVTVQPQHQNILTPHTYQIIFQQISRQVNKDKKQNKEMSQQYSFSILDGRITMHTLKNIGFYFSSKEQLQQFKRLLEDQIQAHIIEQQQQKKKISNKKRKSYNKLIQIDNVNVILNRLGRAKAYRYQYDQHIKRTFQQYLVLKQNQTPWDKPIFKKLNKQNMSQKFKWSDIILLAQQQPIDIYGSQVELEIVQHWRRYYLGEQQMQTSYQMKQLLEKISNELKLQNYKVLSKSFTMQDYQLFVSHLQTIVLENEYKPARAQINRLRSSIVSKQNQLTKLCNKQGKIYHKEECISECREDALLRIFAKWRIVRNGDNLDTESVIYQVTMKLKDIFQVLQQLYQDYVSQVMYPRKKYENHLKGILQRVENKLAEEKRSSEDEGFRTPEKRPSEVPQNAPIKILQQQISPSEWQQQDQSSCEITSMMSIQDEEEDGQVQDSFSLQNDSLTPESSMSEQEQYQSSSSSQSQTNNDSENLEQPTTKHEAVRKVLEYLQKENQSSEMRTGMVGKRREGKALWSNGSQGNAIDLEE